MNRVTTIGPAGRADVQRLAEMAIDPLGIIRIDGSFEWGNRAMRRALTGDEEGRLDRGFTEWVHPDDLRLFTLMMERAAHGSTSHNCLVRVRVREWDLREWEVSIFPDDGRLNLSCRDVTARNHQEREVMRKIELLAMAEKHASLGHWRVDLKNDEIYWSPVTYEIHGLDPTTYRPELESAIDAFHPQDREMVAEVFGEAVESGTGYEFTARLVRADGEIVHVLSRADVECDVNGEATSVFGIFQDITEQLRQAQRNELSNRLASLGTFAAGIAHEVNNPLAFATANLEYIRSFLGDLVERSTVDDAQEPLAACVDALEGAERVASIIDKLRAFSVGSAATVSDIDLVWLVKSCVDSCNLFDEGRVSVEAEFPATVVGDSVVLRTVFDELLSNASAAVQDEEHPQIVATISHDGQSVIVRISDNGIGIEKEMLDHVFDPFYTSRDVDEGRGLGLSTCLGIVTSLGGSIDIESEPGVGTDVFVRLHGSVENPEHSEPTAVESVVAQPLVFLVDDEPLVGRAITRLLSSDHDVRFFDSADSALRSISAGELPDAVISDVTMPGMSGIEFFREVGRIEPEICARFAFLTGGAFRASAEEFLSRTNAPRITKPFSPDRLREVVAGLLAN